MYPLIIDTINAKTKDVQTLFTLKLLDGKRTKCNLLIDLGFQGMTKTNFFYVLTRF